MLCTQCKTLNDEKIQQKLLKFHKEEAEEQHVVRFLSSSSNEKTATLSTQFRMARDLTRRDRTVGDKSKAGSKKKKKPGRQSVRVVPGTSDREQTQ